MYRCIVEPGKTLMVAVDGVPRPLSRNTADQPDDSKLVAAAPWAFEKIEEKPKRGRPRKTTVVSEPVDQTGD